MLSPSTIRIRLDIRVFPPAAVPGGRSANTGDEPPMLIDFVKSLTALVDRLNPLPDASDPLAILRTAAIARRLANDAASLLEEDAGELTDVVLARFNADQRRLLERAIAMPRRLPTRETWATELLDYEAAELLGVSVSRVRAAVHAGELVGDWIGEQATVPLLDFVVWAGTMADS